MASSLIENITPRLKGKNRESWQGTALIVEALIILIVVVACLAVFVRLFSYAYSSNLYDQQRAHAITLATNQAERFAAGECQANGVYVETTEDGYTVTCTVESANAKRGVLYAATITVSKGSTSLYDLETAHYVSAAADEPASVEEANQAEEGGE